MPLRRRGTGLFVVSAALLVVGDLTLGAVHHDAIQQANDTALIGINRQNGMQEQAGMRAIAAIAEAVLAGLVGGKSNSVVSVIASTCRPAARWLVNWPVAASISCAVTAGLARKRPNWIA
jgi:hypothetical protein